MNVLRLCFAVLLVGILDARAAVLSLHPENPHYFLFRGQPTIIITSGEHYGAVLNLDFDYVTYLNTLQAQNLNSTRTFVGAYYEPAGAFNITGNTLAPVLGRYLGPWSRTGIPGAAAGGTKFDLTKLNDSYFARLRDFVRQAGLRGVIVELNLFCPFYDEAQWKLSPMNATNNVNKVGDIARTNVYTLDNNGGLLAYHDTLVRRIALELNQFDNLYYEICNEPYFGGVTLDWQHHIAQTITDAERNLPNKHLISQNIANGATAVGSPDPLVSILNFHYAAPPDAVALNYDLKRVIGDNETGFRGTADLPYRREAWEFILAGGGLFNNLDYSFTVQHPAGTFPFPPNQPGGGGVRYREQLRILRNFIYQYDFLHMQPATNIVRGGVPPGATARVLAHPDRAYAIYLGPSAPPPVTDKYSVRWTGKIRAPRSGEYTFFTQSNDGVRLWINDVQLIENWTPHSQAEDKGTINLTAGKFYDIKLEYFQDGGNAVMRLFWQAPGAPRAIVPMGVLQTSKRLAGLEGEYYRGDTLQDLAFRRVDPIINFDWSGRSPLDVSAQAGGWKTARLELELPRGDYQARWVNPRTGVVENTVLVNARNGRATVASPAFDEDIALDLRAIAAAQSGKRPIQVLR